jgi:hypothetical protein
MRSAAFSFLTPFQVSRMRRHLLLWFTITSIVACSKPADQTATDSAIDSAPTLRASTPAQAKAIRDSVLAAQIGAATPTQSLAAPAPYDSIADARAESTDFAQRSKQMTGRKKCLQQVKADMDERSRAAVIAACNRLADDSRWK